MLVYVKKAWTVLFLEILIRSWVVTGDVSFVITQPVHLFSETQSRQSYRLIQTEVLPFLEPSNKSLVQY